MLAGRRGAAAWLALALALGLPRSGVALECPLACAVWTDGCNDYSCAGGALTQLLTHRSCSVVGGDRARCKRQRRAPTRAPADRCPRGSYSTVVGGRFPHVECRQCPAGRSTPAVGAHGASSCAATAAAAAAVAAPAAPAGTAAARHRAAAAPPTRTACPAECLVYFDGCGTCSCAGGRALSCTKDPRFCRGGRAPGPTHCIARLHAVARDPRQRYMMCPAGKHVRDTAQSADSNNVAQLKCAACPAGRVQPLPDQSSCAARRAPVPTPASCPAGRALRSLPTGLFCVKCPPGQTSVGGVGATCHMLKRPRWTAHPDRYCAPGCHKWFDGCRTCSCSWGAAVGCTVCAPFSAHGVPMCQSGPGARTPQPTPQPVRAQRPRAARAAAAAARRNAATATAAAAGGTATAAAATATAAAAPARAPAAAASLSGIDDVDPEQQKYRFEPVAERRQQRADEHAVEADHRIVRKDERASSRIKAALRADARVAQRPSFSMFKLFDEKQKAKRDAVLLRKAELQVRKAEGVQRAADRVASKVACVGGRVFDLCAGACEATCADPAPACPRVACEAKCTCEKGMLWDDTTFACVVPLGCPVPDPTPAPTAAPTPAPTAYPSPRPTPFPTPFPTPAKCAHECALWYDGCDDFRCVNGIATRLTSRKGCDVRAAQRCKSCAGGQVYRECGRRCTPTCDDPTPSCGLFCVARCECPRGMVWDEPFCVKRSLCKPKRSALAPRHHAACSDGKIWQPCGSPCTPTCADTAPICVGECVARCACPAGHVEHKGACLDPGLCPTTAPTRAPTPVPTPVNCPRPHCVAPELRQHDCTLVYSSKRGRDGCLQHPCGVCCPNVKCDGYRLEGCAYIASNEKKPNGCLKFPCGMVSKCAPTTTKLEQSHKLFLKALQLGASGATHLPVNCILTPWGAWGSCSLPKCGGGVQHRTRSVRVRPAFGGLECPDPSFRTATRNCNVRPCPIDCRARWQPWSPCSATCGGGTTFKEVDVLVQAYNGGKDCPRRQEKVCNAAPCRAPSPRPTAVPTGAPQPRQAANFCAVRLSPWSPCSASCGGGIATRVGEGAKCAWLKEQRVCNLHPCRAAARATATSAPVVAMAPAAAQEQHRCPAGRAGHPCRDCTSGRYSVGGLSADCLECPAGRYGLGASPDRRCSGPCPAGRFGIGGSPSSMCTGACQAGRYGLAGAGAPGCKGPCAAGRYGVGSSSSKLCDGACPLGRFSLSGSRACAPIDRGGDRAQPRARRRAAMGPSLSWALQIMGRKASAVGAQQVRQVSAGIAASLALHASAVRIVSVRSGGDAAGGGAGRSSTLLAVRVAAGSGEEAAEVSREVQAPSYRRMLASYINAKVFASSRVRASDLVIGQVLMMSSRSGVQAPSSAQRVGVGGADGNGGGAPAAAAISGGRERREGDRQAVQSTPALAVAFVLLLLVASRVGQSRAPAAQVPQLQHLQMSMPPHPHGADPRVRGAPPLAHPPYSYHQEQQPPHAPQLNSHQHGYAPSQQQQQQQQQHGHAHQQQHQHQRQPLQSHQHSRDARETEQARAVPQSGAQSHHAHANEGQNVL